MNFSFNENEDYGDDYDDEVCDKADLVQFGSIAIPVFFSVVIILSLIGNILVLAILALYENLKTLHNILILNLAISDLLFTAGLPFWAIYHIWGWVLADVLCNIVNFIFYTGFYSSILLLTIITLHRYLAVVHPLSKQGIQKAGCYAIAVSITLWLVSMGAAMPSMLFSTVTPIPNQNQTYACQYKDTTWTNVSIYQQNIIFLAAFSVMSFCYVRIVTTIRRTRSHRKYRTVKLIFCIVAVFFVGWIPYNVIIFLRSLSHYLVPPFDNCEVSTALDYAFFVCRLIAFSHCCLNPVFYAFVGVKFRCHLNALLYRKTAHQVKVEEASNAFI
ncbi:Chemokine XC receptor 1 [Merluccius polli]|uniref:Chemokine XC receptor 1 n=1 Tax=Merluccius polli TaxID=89951 RepID=A0AA47N0M7_MERPO|nr:Chemokine XC receptor 1 [Merluccius polli]